MDGCKFDSILHHLDGCKFDCILHNLSYHVEVVVLTFTILM
mgnify:FL=1